MMDCSGENYCLKEEILKNSLLKNQCHSTCTFQNIAYEVVVAIEKVEVKLRIVGKLKIDYYFFFLHSEYNYM